MAVKFFRMSEKGSIKRPTLIALGCTASSCIVAMFFLRDHPILCLFIAWPLLYLFFAVMLSSPFRIALCKFMHWTRYPIIMSIPTPADKAWLEANHVVFKKTGLKMFLGDSGEKKVSNANDSSMSPYLTKKIPKKIKVIYEDDRRP